MAELSAAIVQWFPSGQGKPPAVGGSATEELGLDFQEHDRLMPLQDDSARMSLRAQDQPTSGNRSWSHRRG